MAMDADDTWLTSLTFGGCVARTAPRMNIMTAIHAAPARSELRLPILSMPKSRKSPVEIILTVPYTPVANNEALVLETPTVWKI